MTITVNEKTRLMSFVTRAQRLANKVSRIRTRPVSFAWVATDMDDIAFDLLRVVCAAEVIPDKPLSIPGSTGSTPPALVPPPSSQSGTT